MSHGLSPKGITDSYFINPVPILLLTSSPRSVNSVYWRTEFRNQDLGIKRKIALEQGCKTW
jgi:hypothetical protein